MDYREELAQLVEKWTEDKIDIRDNWNEWEEFLTKEGIIKTYDEVYEMDLRYLVDNQLLSFFDEDKKEWNVDKCIQFDDDITKMSNGCYFCHMQINIDDFIIEEFYQEQKEKEQQKETEQAITQAYTQLYEKYDENGFNRFKALLLILRNNFGKEKLYFLTDINKVKRELLYCINEVLIDHINTSVDNGYSKLWIPNHVHSNNEDEHYCELIRFSGYQILENGAEILESDVIILEEEDNNQTLHYFTYQNIDEFCDYIESAFNYYINDFEYIDNKKYLYEENQKINDIIFKYWGNTIEFDYAQFLNEKE